MSTANQIDHIAIVIDASDSMRRLTKAVIRVVDNQIAYLARRSTELNREVRVSVYTFADDVICEIFDKDVLRLPSIASLYKTRGMTALIDATVQSQRDLATTSTIYGDHAFLTFVVTDGYENASRRNGPARLRELMENQADNYTLATLVPDHQAMDLAARNGFPRDNIRPWDATSEAGVEQAGDTILGATETFFRGRAAGVRGSRAIFSTGEDAVNAATVAQADLTALPADRYRLVPVPTDGVEIRPFVQGLGLDYKVGNVFYELGNSLVDIQGQKQVAIVDRASDRVLYDPVDNGPKVRALVGLPDIKVRKRADRNSKYATFVQSTSVNRKLKVGTRVLVLL